MNRRFDANVAERQRFATALQQGWHFTATGFGR
jgi:hypothetical protein